MHALDYSREATRLAKLADQTTTPGLKIALTTRASDYKVLAEGGTLPPGRMVELTSPNVLAVLGPTKAASDWASALTSDWAEVLKPQRHDRKSGDIT